MLRVLRKKPGKHAFVVAMTTLLLITVSVPARVSLASVHARLLEHELLRQWPDDADEALVAALHSVLAAGPVSVEQFVDAFLEELGDSDGETARAVLTQVLPGFSPNPSVNAVWLIELRRISQADRVPSVRTLAKAPSSFSLSGRGDRYVRAVGAVARSSLGPNLTRGMIRSLISVWALGP